MHKKNSISLTVLTAVLLFGCTNESALNIKLPNGKIINATKILEIEKQYNCNYEQYVGFVMDYEDSLFSKPILLLKDNSNIVGADVINEKRIEELKKNKIVGIRFTYKLPNEQKGRDTLFEAQLKNCYKDYDEEIKIKNGFELKKSGKSYVVVELHTFRNPNYSILIYPVK